MSELIGVVGAGTMGLGIARLCGQSGCSVLLHDSRPEALSSARERLVKGLESAVRGGRLDAEAAERARRSVRAARGLVEFKDADFVFEAVSEDLPLKQALFRDLDALLPERAVLATNTSSFSVQAVSERLLRPDRVLGLHFFNPPYAMKLVEIVRSSKTSDRAFRKAWDLALALGRLPVEAKDTPGFIVNRVLRPFYLESQRAAAEGWGAYSAFDAALRAVEKLPMGPFELMDLIG
ncbi:MAG: 3-hydroxyacyl-CoA dehydrogenase family protein, partial [Elusimicrobiota bacterium]